jgi:hypothetical protein
MNDTAVSVIWSRQKTSLSGHSLVAANTASVTIAQKEVSIPLKLRGIMMLCRESKLPARQWHPPCDVSRRTPPGSTKEIMEQDS